MSARYYICYNCKRQEMLMDLIEGSIVCACCNVSIDHISPRMLKHMRGENTDPIEDPVAKSEGPRGK